MSVKLEDIQQVFEEFFNENTENSGLILLSDSDGRGYKFLCGKKSNVVNLLYNVFMSDENDEVIGLIDEAAKKYMEKKQTEIDRNNLIWFVAGKNKYKS